MAHDSKLVYEGKIIDVELTSVRLPNGADCTLELVRHPGGATALAIDASDRVCLLKQYRYAANDWVWELPAGRLEPGEAPLTTAKRELAEEAGVLARRWTPLGDLLTSPGVFSEVIHIFLAQGLTQTPPAPEQHEIYELHWLPLDEALQWALTGVIRDAKTLAGLFRGKEYLRSSTTSAG